MSVLIPKSVMLLAYLDREALHDLDNEIEDARNYAQEQIREIYDNEPPSEERLRKISNIRRNRDKLILRLEEQKRAIHRDSGDLSEQEQRNISAGKKIVRGLGKVVGCTAGYAVIGAAAAVGAALSVVLSIGKDVIQSLQED